MDTVHIPYAKTRRNSRAILRVTTTIRFLPASLKTSPGPTPMPLTIETPEAAALARGLARLTGESMAEAITTVLRERLARERARREGPADLTARVTALASQLRAEYGTTPITRAEWNAAAGEQ